MNEYESDQHNEKKKAITSIHQSSETILTRLSHTKAGSALELCLPFKYRYNAQHTH